MDFYHDPDHTEMASATADLLRQSFGADQLRETAGFADARDGVWAMLAEMGLHGVLIAEGNGGLELGWPAATLMMREIGRAGVPGPFVDTICVAPALLRELDGAGPAELAAEIAAGKTTVGVADGTGLVAADGVDVVLAVDGGTVRALPAEPGLFSPVPTLDSAMPLYRLTGSAGSAAELFRADAPADAASRIAASGAVASAAMLTGVTARIIDMTRDYIGQREQFGKIVGSFQAVQHALVDAALAATFAVPVVDAAAWELEHNTDSAHLAVAHAKIAACRAAHRASQTGLQLHGAIGYTYEYDLQHFLKRAMTLMSAWGSESHHRANLRSALITEGAAV